MVGILKTLHFKSTNFNEEKYRLDQDFGDHENAQYNEGLPKTLQFHPYQPNNERFRLPKTLQFHPYQSSFCNCAQLRTVEIPRDSKLRVIEKDAFDGTQIESLFIPSSLVELEEGWSKGTYKLNNIEIDENNPRYSIYDNKIIIGKRNIETRNYNEIVFSTRNITNITIPNFIENINSYSFYECQNLTEIEISKESKLGIINEYSFSKTSIEHIALPPHLTRINSKSFYDCKRLKCVIFPINSELQRIGEEAFSGSQIKSFHIPPHVTNIDKNAFDNVRLQIVEIDEKTESFSDYYRIFRYCYGIIIMIPVKLKFQNEEKSIINYD